VSVNKEMFVPVDLWEEIMKTLRTYASPLMYRGHWNRPATILVHDKGEQARAILERIKEKGLPTK